MVFLIMITLEDGVTNLINFMCIRNNYVNCNYPLCEQDFEEVYAVAHSFLADCIAKYLPGKNEAYILDVAAGTGLVAQKV